MLRIDNTARFRILRDVNDSNTNLGKEPEGLLDMSLRIHGIAPDFTAETTQGPIRFHEWIEDN
jgi:hypothetical protein